ncbi:MAG: hypothetical protein LBD78_07130 [Spirochaetaceae bacterium]|jgi:hypothetical protein|nr:hypothetical protein [Spirochaetaceae bacterium]
MHPCPLAGQGTVDAQDNEFPVPEIADTVEITGHHRSFHAGCSGTLTPE